MMRWVVRSSLKMRRLVVAVALGIMVLGVVQLGQTPVDVLPEFSPVQVEVQTEALGLSAAEVEQLITVPLEQDLLNGVAFLERIESTSLPGLSSVVMTFKPGTGLLQARQVVNERLTQAVGVAGLPSVAKPPQMLQPLSSTSRVAMIRLSSETLSPIETSVLARWLLVPRLLGVDGVANVSIWGQRERQLQVQVDPERLHANGVSLGEIIATAGNALEVSPLTFLEASSPGTGGFIENLNQRLQIFHEQTINTADELAQVPIEDSEGGAMLARGRPLALGDVATVVEDHQPLIGDALCRGGKCILLVVEKFPGANTVEVTRNIDAALDAMRPGLGDVQLDSSVYRPADFTEWAFANVTRTLAIGAALALFVIAVFLRKWRSILVAVASIGVSVMAAVLVLRARGTTVNLMAMTGFIMALGVLVADAVGDAGSVGRRVRRLRAKDPATPILWTAAVEATLEMRRAAVAGGLVVAAAMIPLVFMSGEGGAFLPPVARSFLLAIGVSMVVALTVTPALSVLLLGKAPEGELPATQSGLGRRYAAFAGRGLGKTTTVVLVAGAMLLAAVAMLPFANLSLRPSLGERDVLVDVESEPGTSLPKMRDLVAQAVDELGGLPGVRMVAAHVGRAILSDQRVNVNSGQIWVSLAGDADRAAVGRIKSVMDRYEGIDETVRTYVEERASEVLDTQSEDVVVRVYGENSDIRGLKAEEIRRRIARIEGIDEPEIKQPRVESTVEVEVNLQQAQAVGIKPGDVRRTATTLISGITVGNLFQDQKVFDVVVWGIPEIRRSVDDLRNLRIETPSGDMVRLGDIAEVRIAPNRTAIRHESVSNYLDVTAGVKGRNVGAVTADVQRAIRSVDFPLEHHAEVLGGYAMKQETRGRVLAGAVAAAITIYLMFQAAFTSWRLALLATAALPVALTGGLVAIAITGRTISLGAIAGLLALLGLSARHVVMLIRRYEQLERGGMPFGPGLVVRGTQDRLMPILATTVGIGLLQLPFAVSGGAGLDLIRPMALVVAGGLVTSTFVSLVLVPALYLRFGRAAGAGEEEMFVIPLPELDQAAQRPGAAISPPEPAGPVPGGIIASVEHPADSPGGAG